MVTAKVVPVYLTPKRRKLLGLIQEFHDMNGYAPTTRELQAEMGDASQSTTHVHMAILRNQGLVDWSDGQARTIHLTPDGRSALLVL